MKSLIIIAGLWYLGIMLGGDQWARQSEVIPPTCAAGVECLSVERPYVNGSENTSGDVADWNYVSELIDEDMDLWLLGQ